jgi:hypothetical protein
MKERLFDRIKRSIHEAHILRYKRIIRKYVQKLDRAQWFAFMAYSWGADEVTDYHVIAERCYPDRHIFGTKIEWYDSQEKEG